MPAVRLLESTLLGRFLLENYFIAKSNGKPFPARRTMRIPNSIKKMVKKRLEYRKDENGDNFNYKFQPL